jgi:hypothetical protein
VACVLLALNAAPAVASCGGIYAPGVTQPTCVASHPAQQHAYFELLAKYYKALGTKVKGGALAHGSFSAGLAPASQNGPSVRAGIGSGSLGLAPLAIVAALALLAGALATFRRPQR